MGYVVHWVRSYGAHRYMDLERRGFDSFIHDINFLILLLETLRALSLARGQQYNVDHKFMKMALRVSGGHAWLLHVTVRSIEENRVPQRRSISDTTTHVCPDFFFLTDRHRIAWQVSTTYTPIAVLV